MSSQRPPTHVPVDDPDHDWKPRNRPQSTIAINFMTELDDLFRLDGGIDLLDKNVHQKKQQVTSHTQELEALEAKLRATEERLKEARVSPPRPRDSQLSTPQQDAFSEAEKARQTGSPQPKESMALRDRPPSLHPKGDANGA